MDSKYAVFGETSEVTANNFKRKKQLGNMQVKRIKLSSETKHKPDGNYEETFKTKENNIDKNTTVDLLESRRKLPVYMVKSRLLEEIIKYNTVILIGETGSGKTTQIPQLIHEQRLEGTCAIAVTQPRRVAAITVAMRVAAETNSEIGTIVGYSVRFEDVTSPKTKVKYLTDGMLLREAINDPLLRKYSFIILDEAHERTINTDVLFGIVKLAQNERNEKKLHPLKIIIMSATMDVDVFSKYFENCPVIYLEGRTHPVTIYHSKLKQEDYQYAAVCTIFQLHATTPANHDFLVFLTGQEEIETVMHNIKQISKEAKGPPMRVCPLYAGLPPARQLQVWRETPSGVRKVVLATNIAEASLTIPRIKCVIDTGVVKQRTWCTSTGAERLTVRPCAQAACWQRAGRAGRTSPGVAYRLYTAQQFKERPAHTTPEIVRCPLAPTILLLTAAGMEPSTFPLIDPPPRDAIQASLVLLKELGAGRLTSSLGCFDRVFYGDVEVATVAGDNSGLLGAIDSEVTPKLTVLGKKMAAFPIDPKYSKVLLSAPEFGCLEEALSIVAVLSSENVFHTPMHKREEAVKVKQKFISPSGDHITLLNVFNAYTKAPLKKQWCKENYLNNKNLSHACDIRRQLLSICLRFNMNVTSCGSATDQLLKCLLSGLYTNCAWLRVAAGASAGAGVRYVTASGAPATLHPAGVLHPVRPPPPAVLYTELLHTRRSYMITVSAIQPQWLQQVASEFARRCRANR